MAVAVEARIGGKLRLFQDGGAEARPFALVLDAEEHGLAVADRERPVGMDGGVRGAGARRRGAAVGGEVGGIAHPLAQRLEHRDVEGRAFAGASRADTAR